MEDLKTCTKCGVPKPLSEFYKDKQKKDGLRPDCRVCNTKQCVKRAKINRTSRNWNSLKHKTGISKNTYQILLDEQQGKCAICGKTIGENGRNLSIDHCHNSKIIRGLLCTKCNFGIGYFDDRKDLLTKAIHYLDNNLSTKNIIHK
jgi:hypothetical protein